MFQRRRRPHAHMLNWIGLDWMYPEGLGIKFQKASCLGAFIPGRRIPRKEIGDFPKDFCLGEIKFIIFKRIIVWGKILLFCSKAFLFWENNILLFFKSIFVGENKNVLFFKSILVGENKNPYYLM